MKKNIAKIKKKKKNEKKMLGGDEVCVFDLISFFRGGKVPRG